MRRAWLHSVRLRLALWYALSIALVLAASGAMLHELVRYQLVRHHDADLTAAAAAVARVLAANEGLEPTAAQRAELDAIRHVVLVAAVQPDRPVFYTSPSSSGADIPVGRPAAAPPPGEGRFETIPGQGEPVRTYARAYGGRSGSSFSIHVAHGLGDLPATLASLRLGLLLMAPLAALLSAVGGYWLAARALAPVDAVTRLAREIGASSLSRRLKPPRAHDEVGRLVETFNQMIGRLESSFEAMKRFTADASHELRGPLATMRGAIDVSLSRPRSPTEYRETLASVGEDVDRLRSITEDLLVLARADAGRLSLDRQPVRVDVLAAEVLDSFASLAGERGVALALARAEPVQVEGDEGWLRQLVFNLVDNAVEFSSGAKATTRGPEVSLAVARRDNAAILEVADTGPGIPEGALPRLFERFFRADEARPYQGREGFGLGLAIAAWVVEAHGGSITAANRPGGGSLFSVVLPAATAGRPRSVGSPDCST